MNEQVNIKSEIHSIITPADIREGDPIFCKITYIDDGRSQTSDFRVWRISPLGVEILDSKNTNLKKGEEIEIYLKIGTNVSILNGIIVDHVVHEKNNRIVHARLITKNQIRETGVERRQSNRWFCNENYFPTAICSNPVLFNDYMYFKIRDISNGGMRLTTSLRNKFLIQGMTLDCIVNFPMISQLKIKFLITTARIEIDNNKEVLGLGVTFVRNDINDAVVSQYLMQFSSVNSLEDLVAEKLIPESVGESVTFGYVREKEEYEQVLKLRLETYKLAGKVDASKTYLDMSDELDSRSRIVVGKYKGQVISSARLIFSSSEESMEQENYVKWPSDLPRRDEVVEIMRVCTSPAFRGSDLLFSMFHYMAIAIAQSGRRNIVICCTNEMIPLYKNIGFSETGLSYEHQKLNKLKHTILIGDVLNAMLGLNVGPIAWNVVWHDVSSYLMNYDSGNIEPFAKIRVGIYKLIRPICMLMYKISKKNRKNKNAKLTQSV